MAGREVWTAFETHAHSHFAARQLQLQVQRWALSSEQLAHLQVYTVGRTVLASVRQPLVASFTRQWRQFRHRAAYSAAPE